MCQVLPTVPAAEGHQVDQLESVILPTDSTGPEREGGREECLCCGRIKPDENKVGVKELIQESETERKVELLKRVTPGERKH